MVEKVDQLMEGHIVPQGLRTAGQGGVQGNIPLLVMAVAPLAPHVPQLDLGQGHAAPGHQGIDPDHRLPQQAGAGRPVRLRQQGRTLLPWKVPPDPFPLFQDQGVRPLLRTAKGDGKQDLPPPVQPEIQIFHPLFDQQVGLGTLRRVHHAVLLHTLRLLFRISGILPKFLRNGKAHPYPLCARCSAQSAWSC